METILKKIQDTVIKYANVISEILKVDIEIVDQNLIRIAGTGEYEKGINQSLEDEYVYKEVLQSGKHQIIREPGKNSICQKCPKRFTCIEKFEACTPIKMEDEVIGVIGLICFHEEQREFLLSNFDTYFSFLEQIADFISAKAYEKKEIENTETMIGVLNSIMENLEEAIIVLDNNDCISHTNKNAKNILEIHDEFHHKVILIPTGNYILEQQEYELIFKGKIYNLVGSIHEIHMKKNEYDRMFIFNEARVIKSKILDMTNLNHNLSLNKILGESSKLVNLKRRVLQIAKASSTVLITGESGTGKEMFARAIHNESNRKEEAFVPINCGAIPDTLLESELFGYVKGAFTGANTNGKIGKFEFANKGTIFLDEIGDMPIYMQVKLLRVLQEKEIMKIGSNKAIEIDVRVIAATNKNIEEMIKDGSFREDLYYRLNVIPIEIPPLRERIEDIKVITYYFANKYAKLFQKKFIGIDRSVWTFMLSYSWPGNVRELENAIEFMINMMDASGIIIPEILPRKLTTIDEGDQKQNKAEIFDLDQIEKDTIKRALKMYGSTTECKQIVAQKLGIGIATLYRKISKYNL
ncbi:sigma-54-dependent Fis family transcriptional regulator [Crassaminicella profunda]|uniref:sigma-54-dependent Fis family transcriptional regulator n=1 Tax=Crassaminicella profunda TaxID=1286698 RepID=UPI001CA783EA|nr:sigma 54-interacting transcriptional regulator [Crassaminicella profunda]QZY54822.1 sigma 54-interacting transcriptional regulator [Crassaminicella profunda]